MFFLFNDFPTMLAKEWFTPICPPLSFPTFPEVILVPLSIFFTWTFLAFLCRETQIQVSEPQQETHTSHKTSGRVEGMCIF